MPFLPFCSFAIIMDSQNNDRSLDLGLTSTVALDFTHYSSWAAPGASAVGNGNNPKG